MHKVKVNKYYNGLLSVLDYDCVKAMQKGGLQIEQEGKIVLEVDNKSIDYALKNNPNKAIRSKFAKAKPYKLVDFRYSRKEKGADQLSLI